jgi:hypothetical protein
MPIDRQPQSRELERYSRRRCSRLDVGCHVGNGTMYGRAVRRKRTSRVGSSGLAFMYPAFD